MLMGSHTKCGTTFCGKPVCVGDVQCPKGAMTEAPKGLRERNMSLYSVRNYLLGYRRTSEVDILVKKHPYFHGRLASLLYCTHRGKMTVSIISLWDFILNTTCTLPDLKELHPQFGCEAIVKYGR